MRDRRYFTSLSTHLIASLMISATFAQPPALARQQSANKAEFPATPVGKLAGAFIEAINSGGAPGINSDLQMFWDGSYTVIVMGNYDPPAAQELAGKISKFLARQ
jgi:hypothetical protein